MKVPFCEFCIKTSFLCKICEEKKLKNEKEFIISKYLYENFPKANCEFISSEEIDDFLILFFNGDVGKIIGRKGEKIKKLSEIVKKKIKIITLNSDRRKIIEDLIKPAEVLRMSEVYGEEEILKIKIPKKDLTKLPFSISSIEKILSKIFNKKTKLLFE